MTPDSSQPQRPSVGDVKRDLRQLELVDRIIGLEAENARLSALFIKPAGPKFGYNRMLTDVWSSRTWRAGRALLSPIRALSTIRDRISGAPR